MKKKFQIFSKIFFNFFPFFGHPSQTKRFFCTFGPKITNFYILGGQHVHLTPKKRFLEAQTTSCPQNNPHPPVNTLTFRSACTVGLRALLQKI